MVRSLAIAGSEADLVVPEDLTEPPEQCSEGDTSEKQSEAASKTLGTEDTFSTQGVRLNAQEKTWNVQCEPSVAGDDRAMRKETQEVIKKPFASLFAKNRLPSNGSKLEYFNLEEGPIKLSEEAIQGSDCPWERSLVGYFGGRFPGRPALNQLVASWKVFPSIQFHQSGWIVF